MTKNAISQADIWSHLEGVREKWERDRNPVGVWFAIAVCNDHGAEFPSWIRDYLSECARRVLDASLDEEAGRHVRDVLPGIFQFVGRRGHQSQLTRTHDELETEKFAMAFAAGIFEGLTPVQAKNRAAKPLPDGKVWGEDAMQPRIRKFFGLKRAPRDTKSWRTHLLQWFLTRPEFLSIYRQRFPALPSMMDIFAEILQTAGGGTITMKADRTFSLTARNGPLKP